MGYRFDIIIHYHHNFIILIMCSYINITIFLVLWFRLLHFKPGQFNSFHFWMICFPFEFAN